eukprot:2750467-Amphidinium_carterae.1
METKTARHPNTCLGVLVSLSFDCLVFCVRVSMHVSLLKEAMTLEKRGWLLTRCRNPLSMWVAFGAQGSSACGSSSGIGATLEGRVGMTSVLMKLSRYMATGTG